MGSILVLAYVLTVLTALNKSFVISMSLSPRV